MRIGLIGAGAMGGTHAAAWARIEGVEVAGVVARRAERAAALAARIGAPARTDPRALFEDPSVDAIDVTAPTVHHRALVTAALAHGKHVLCETPLAANVADADAMIAAARASGRHLQVGLLMRIAEPGASLRGSILSGALGAPIAATMYRLWPGRDQRAGGDAPTHHGDALEELALFDFDYLLWCLGVPEAVTAHGVIGADGGVDHAITVLEQGGFRAFVEASRLATASYGFQLGGRLVLDAGMLEWGLRFPDDGPPSVRVVRHPRRGAAEPVQIAGFDPYEAECRRFARVVRGDDDPALLSGEAAREGLRVVEAARASLARGARVVLAPD